MEVKSLGYNSSKPCAVVEATTPDGKMFVVITEDVKDNNDPDEIFIHMGKSGSALAAWAEATSRLCNLALSHGADIDELCEELTGISSDKLSFMAGRVPVRSGPEGLAVALHTYKKSKVKKKSINTILSENYE